MSSEGAEGHEGVRDCIESIVKVAVLARHPEVAGGLEGVEHPTAVLDGVAAAGEQPGGDDRDDGDSDIEERGDRLASDGEVEGLHWCGDGHGGPVAGRGCAAVSRRRVWFRAAYRVNRSGAVWIVGLPAAIGRRPEASWRVTPEP